jgi:hypothetical protein
MAVYSFSRPRLPDPVTEELVHLPKSAS